MKLLITSGNSRLARELAKTLVWTYTLRLTDRSRPDKGSEVILSDLGHDEATNQLVRGMAGIVHLGQGDARLSATELLDHQTRGTYNLLRAAAEEGVPRFVYLSSLSVMSKYDEDLAVTERWRPTPTTDPQVLACHLGEFVCREFAREKRITVVCLRLGEIVWDERARAVPTDALGVADAVQAVRQALVAPVQHWGLFHVQSPVPRARFLTLAAEKTMGYTPEFRGGDAR